MSPQPVIPKNLDLRRGLVERVAVMEARARQIVDDALAAPVRADWVADLGAPPEDPAAREAWMQNARTVAAYREIHGYHGPNAKMADNAHGPRQIGDARAAEKDAARARLIAAYHQPSALAPTQPSAGMTASIPRAAVRPGEGISH